MVLERHPVRCVTIALLGFRCQISNSGLLDSAAQEAWRSVFSSIGDLHCVTNIVWGMTSGQTCSLALFVEHEHDETQSCSYYGDKLPHNNIKRIRSIIRSLYPFLAEEPKVYDTVFKSGEILWWPALERPLTFDIAYFKVQNDSWLLQEPRPFTRTVVNKIDEPLSSMSFARSCKTHLHRTSRKRGCCRLPYGAMQDALAVHTFESYLRDPLAGEAAEQVYVIQWKCAQERDEFKRSAWWLSVFEKQLEEAQSEGKVSDCQRWSIEIPRRPSSTSQVCWSSRLTTFVTSILGTLLAKLLCIDEGRAREYDETSSDLKVAREKLTTKGGKPGVKVEVVEVGMDLRGRR